jgi:hypothetical protein
MPKGGGSMGNDSRQKLMTGSSAREVIDLSVNLELFTEDEFHSHSGKQTRELAAAAYFCFATRGAAADGITLRVCAKDPPDVEIEFEGGSELLEVVVLLAKGARPTKMAKNSNVPGKRPPKLPPQNSERR